MNDRDRIIDEAFKPAVSARAEDYCYTLAHDFEWAGAPDAGGVFVFCDERGREWLRIVRGTIFVRAGYSWDGCSSAPDGATDPTTGKPITYYASCVHDALYQFIKTRDFPYTRAQCDGIFYRLLREAGFPFARLYWLGVRLFGWTHV